MKKLTKGNVKQAIAWGSNSAEFVDLDGIQIEKNKKDKELILIFVPLIISDAALISINSLKDIENALSRFWPLTPYGAAGIIKFKGKPCFTFTPGLNY